MHTVKTIVELWASVLVLFFTYRAWAGGLFDSGLERLFGWTPANADDSAWLPELERDCYVQDRDFS